MNETTFHCEYPQPQHRGQRRRRFMRSIVAAVSSVAFTATALASPVVAQPVTPVSAAPPGTAPSPDHVSPQSRAQQFPQNDLCENAVPNSPQWRWCEDQNFLHTFNSAKHQGALRNQLVQDTIQFHIKRRQDFAADPERRPDINPCSLPFMCVIDPRVIDFRAQGGIVEPVLYTSRSGATISAHIWSWPDTPGQQTDGQQATGHRKPGVVISNGSITTAEHHFWYAAQALARAGFVVMTFDSQGEGDSDQLGEHPDELEAAGAATPGTGWLQYQHTGDILGGNGLTYYDGLEDALDFFFSSEQQPFHPRNSRSNTSHDGKQQRRVAEGHNAAFNPLHASLDTTKVGVTGHSYGAIAATWVAQADPRVKAAVGWDNMCIPQSPSRDEFEALAGPNPDYDLGLLTGTRGTTVDCFGAPNGPAPEITKPTMGLSADYLMPPFPYLSAPHPRAKARSSDIFSSKGVDTGMVVIRGGTHFDFMDTPGVSPATVRGVDMISWYTTAWFLKYLADDPQGEKMLRTDRWNHDPKTAELDVLRDASLLSWHYDSRMDIGADNGSSRFRCENLRGGCEGMTDFGDDGFVGEYHFNSPFPSA